MVVRDLALGCAVMVAASACGGSTSSSEREPESRPAFVAVGAEGTIVRSSDGLSWSPVRSGVSSSLTSVAAGDAALVAVGARGTILSSPDGASWVTRASGTTTDLSHVIFTGEEYVAVGGSWESGAITLKSRDAVTWSVLESPANYMFHAVAHLGSTLVAAAYYRSDLQTPALFVATAGAGASSAGGWTQQQGPNFYDSLGVDGAIKVIGGGSIASSTDGISWTTHALPGSLPGTGIAASPSTLVVSGEFGRMFTADRGCGAAECWTERQAGTQTSYFGGVAHGAAVFVAVGQDGAIVTASDVRTWTEQASGTSQALYDVAYGPTPFFQ